MNVYTHQMELWLFLVNIHLLGILTVTYAEHFRKLEQLLVDIRFNETDLLTPNQKWTYVILMKACDTINVN